MDDTNVTFFFQFGLLRDLVTLNSSCFTLKTLKDAACNFVNVKCPEHGLSRLAERILLFRHNYSCVQILEPVNNTIDITNKSIIEIVLSGQSLSEENEAPNIKPHKLVVYSYKTPTFCDYCGQMLFGIIRQGLKCSDCNLNFHKRCIVKLNDCDIGNQYNYKPYDTNFNASILSNITDDPVNEYLLDVPVSSKSRSPSPVKIPHTFIIHSYTKPTICQYCKKLLKGVFKQGMQCKNCNYNAHKKCIEFVPKNCVNDEIDSNESCKSDTYDNEKPTYTSSIITNSHKGPNSSNSMEITEHLLDDVSKDDLNVFKSTNNIPLMRIVQSIKHTKQINSDLKIIKEGWLVHYTNTDNQRKSHFWRLDSKAITLYTNDKTSKYYKEIALSDILGINIAMESHDSELDHCFELKTTTLVYYVGIQKQNSTAQLDSENSINTKDDTWENAIQRALMPISSDPTMSCSIVEKNDDQIINFHDLSKSYQIFADDILGSGQFGIVYSGKHRNSGKAVAIKVIDKLRFPTRQEAALKNEVSILGKLDHPSVVNLDCMFETTDRIFVVMEKLSGDMLEMILSSQQRRLSERITKFLITQILIALKHLHSKNIVHCDLKPENVLLSSNSDFPQIKLCDFGFARIIGEKSFRRSVVGTPAYLAPEVLRNKGYNRSLDMWSVGVIVYVCLSGTFPFNEEEDIHVQIKNADFMYPRNPWNEISHDAIDLINNLLQVKQRKRFTVDKSLLHKWLQDYQTWCDLRYLEKSLGNSTRFLTHESDDAHWEAYERQSRFL